MVDQKLTDYVNSAVKSGKSIDAVRKELLGQGWPEGEVNQAISAVQKVGKPKEKPTYKKEEKKTGSKLEKGHRNAFIIGLIIIVLIIGATVYYIVTFTEFELGFLSRISETCGNGVCDAEENYDNCPADCPKPQPAGAQKISVSPAAQTVNVGDTVIVEIKVSNANDLYGFQFNIEYDPDVLEYKSIEQGTFLSRNGADQTYPINPQVSPGLLENIVLSRLGPVGGLNGDGTLEKITFIAVGAGTSDIKMSNIKFVNSKPEQIATTGENGQVTVS